MAIHSMTGFARAEGTLPHIRYYWELRAVNGKGLDIRLRLPPGLESLETDCRQRIGAVLVRGNVQAALTVAQDQQAAVPAVNQAALDAAIVAAQEIAARLGGSKAPTIDTLMSVKGVLELVEPDIFGDDPKASSAAILNTLDAAVAELQKVRAVEGAALAGVLGRNIDEIERLAAVALTDPARNIEAIRTNLAEQVERLTQANGTLDPARLHQEAAFLATKADIKEELDRLQAHVEAARKLLAQGGAIGRKLDFLAQEFNRESNTICSKSNAASLTAIGLEMKVAIDQFREQLQNLE